MSTLGTGTLGSGTLGNPSTDAQVIVYPVTSVAPASAFTSKAADSTHTSAAPASGFTSKIKGTVQ